MKFAQLSILLICIGLMVIACTEDPGPIPEGLSRIEVKCAGLGTPQIAAAVDTNGYLIVCEKKLKCYIYGEVNLDVHPDTYDVLSDGQPFEKVTFTGPGEKITVWWYNVEIPEVEWISF